MDESPVQSLRDRIDTEIAASGDAIVDRVVRHYVDAEQDRRSKILIAAVTAIRESESDLKKINRGDVIYYDGAGAIVQQTYTKPRLVEIKKLADRKAKLDAALKKALVDKTADDFVKLEKAVKSKGGGSPNEEEGDGDE